MNAAEIVECDADVETFDDGDPSTFAVCLCGWSEVCPDEEVARAVAVIHQRNSDDATARHKARHDNDTT
ncbi:hypothetical protein ACTG9Q_28325 [Actinokineospora sp. 24-640]